MFKRSQRINSERFREVMKSPKVIRGDFVYIRFIENDLNASRFSVVVPKKVVKSAVSRHFIKRKIVNLLKKVSKEYPVNDYLVFVSKDIKDVSIDDIKSDLINIRQSIN